MMIVEKFCDFHKIEEGSIAIGCDGKSALKTAFDSGTKLFRDVPSFDIVGAIMRLRRQSRLRWTTRFVKGHQDNTSDDLDTWAARNVLMDAWAKQHLQIASKVPRHFSVKGEPWQLWLQGRKLTSRIDSQIYSAVHKESSLEYWKTKKDVPPEAVSRVDWPAIGRAMKGVPRGRRVFVTKHVAGMCGVGKFMKRWKYWNTDQCPRCGEAEDAPHVWTCSDPGARDIWNKSVDNLDLFLRKQDTDPTLLHIIKVYLQSWQTGVAISYSPPRAFEQLIQEQSQIGWHRFFEGWFSPGWRDAQQRYY